MNEIRCLQSDLTMSEVHEISADLTLTKLKETKKLIMQPLTEFNDKVFRNQVEKVIVIGEKNAPTHLKFIFYSGIETTQAI